MSAYIQCGANPPYSVTHIDGEYLGIGGGHRWHVMGTVDGDPRDQQGPVAICEYEPSAHVIATLLNATGGVAYLVNAPAEDETTDTEETERD